MPDTTAYNDITSWMRIIKPNQKRTKFFFLENDDMFIVDGKMIKTMPPAYSKYCEFDEFYLHVNVKDKEVMYQAFNMDNPDKIGGAKVESGQFLWDMVERCLLTFFITNNSRLAYSIPGDRSTDNTTTTTSGKNKTYMDYTGQFQSKNPSETRYGAAYNNPSQHTTTHTYSGYGYSSEGYKEREEIRNKLSVLIKQNKTGMAVEFISGQIAKMCEDQKFDGLDLFLVALPIETMNAPLMLAVLNATRGADQLLKDRKTFHDKVKARLANKPGSQKMLGFLSALEPGKEYPGVVKYRAKEKAND